MPRRVIDARYAKDPSLPPDKDITYVLAVHSHPTANTLTDHDIGYILALGHKLKGSFHSVGQFKLGIIAFFSNGTSGSPRCDGFFQYDIPLDETDESTTRKIQKWTVDTAGHWEMKEVATVHHKYRENSMPYIQIIEFP